MGLASNRTLIMQYIRDNWTDTNIMFSGVDNGIPALPYIQVWVNNINSDQAWLGSDSNYNQGDIIVSVFTEDDKGSQVSILADKVVTMLNRKLIYTHCQCKTAVPSEEMTDDGKTRINVRTKYNYLQII